MPLTLDRKAKRMGRFFYGGGTINTLAEIANRDHGLLTGLADDDHTQYQRAFLATAAGLSVSNSVVEGDLVSETIPANTLAAAGQQLAFYATGRFFNNTAGAQTLTLRLRTPLGIVWDSGALSIAQLATNRALVIWGTLIFKGGTDNLLTLSAWIGPTTTWISGAGPVTPGTALFYVAGTTAGHTPLGWTVDRLLRITAQLGVANASLLAEITRYYITRDR